MKIALTNWKTLWDDVRARMAGSSTSDLGFETSADSYWTLVRMLVYKFEMKTSSSGTITPTSTARQINSNGNGTGVEHVPHRGPTGHSGLLVKIPGKMNPCLDFMPLPADCDNQGAHLRKILTD
jgi:hypothetical protein